MARPRLDSSLVEIAKDQLSLSLLDIDMQLLSELVGCTEARDRSVLLTDDSSYRSPHRAKSPGPGLA